MAPSPPILSDLSVLSAVAPQLATALASLTGDIALVIDAGGVIREVARSEAQPVHPAEGWVGRSWAETVTGDTRRKIEMLLRETDQMDVTPRRQVNHPSRVGADLPMSYAAMRLSRGGPVIAVGRDLRAVAAIQQRFVEAQHEMERDYWKLRQEAERKRVLAQVASDAVMIVDGDTLQVREANAAADALFGSRGAPLPVNVRELFERTVRSGRPGEIRTRLASTAEATQIDLSAMPLQAGASRGAPSSPVRILVRARNATLDGTSREGESVVVTDTGGRVLACNAAFYDVCRTKDDPAEGQLLSDLLGDPERQLNAALSEVKRDGMVQRPSIALGGGRLPPFDGSVAAALIVDGEQETIGWTLVTSTPSATRSALGSALTALIGDAGALPIDELLQRVAELTERHAIASALRRSSEDPGQTAVMLGITSEDLTQRRRRLGLER